MISAISVVIGLTLANTIKPGKHIDQVTALRLEERYGGEATKRIESAQAANDESPMMKLVKTIMPSNPIAAVSSETPNMLHLMFFALALGIACTLVPAKVSDPFIRFMDSLFALSAKLIDVVMMIAPYAVACLLFTNLAQFGIDLLQALGWFIVTVLLGLSLHMFGVYSLSVSLAVANQPAGVLPTDQNRHADRVFDLIVERHPPHCAGRDRAQSWAYRARSIRSC